jgi:hypothetical protein
MRKRTRTLLVALVAAVSLMTAGAAWGAYWFWEGRIAAPTTKIKARDALGTQYGRTSFDNTVHTGHRQWLFFILSSGNWDVVFLSCPSGAGCDSYPLAVDGTAYPKAGCYNEFNYLVWTNCRYGTGP